MNMPMVQEDRPVWLQPLTPGFRSLFRKVMQRMWCKSHTWTYPHPHTCLHAQKYTHTHMHAHTCMKQETIVNDTLTSMEMLENYKRCCLLKPTQHWTLNSTSWASLKLHTKTSSWRGGSEAVWSSRRQNQINSTLECQRTWVSRMPHFVSQFFSFVWILQSMNINTVNLKADFKIKITHPVNILILCMVRFIHVKWEEILLEFMQILFHICEILYSKLWELPLPTVSMKEEGALS